MDLLAPLLATMFPSLVARATFRHAQAHGAKTTQDTPKRAARERRIHHGPDQLNVPKMPTTLHRISTASTTRDIFKCTQSRIV